MQNRRFIFPLIACFAATVAHAQPYSESMADCAALHQNAAQWVRSDAAANRLMGAARACAGAALDQAAKEGQAMSRNAMWLKIDAKTEAWQAKGLTAFQSAEFRDWMAYCKSFAQDQGINTSL